MYLQINDISKNIKDKTILNHMNLNVEKATITILKGHNGSGKTMLIRAIAGLIKINSGKILINNQEVVFGKESPEILGVIVETPGFINSYTGRQNLEFLASMRQTTSSQKIAEVLEEVGLKKAADLKVAKYSLGMRQRLAIAQAYMEDQNLILFDEPINGLDTDGIATFAQIVAKLKAAGKTIIIATHDEREIGEIADQVVGISDGEIISEESMTNVKEK